MEGCEKVIERLENELNDAQREAELYLAAKNEALKLNENLEARLQKAQAECMEWVERAEGFHARLQEAEAERDELRVAGATVSEMARRFEAGYHDLKAERDAVVDALCEATGCKDRAALIGDFGGCPEAIALICQSRDDEEKRSDDLEARNQRLVAALQRAITHIGLLSDHDSHNLVLDLDADLSEKAQPPTGHTTQPDAKPPIETWDVIRRWATTTERCWEDFEHVGHALLELRQRLDALTGSSTRDAFYDINKRLDALEKANDIMGDEIKGLLARTGPPVKEGDA